MSDLLYSELEEELRGTVRALLADRAAWPAVLARTESDEPVDTKLWRSLSAEVGVTALAVPEALGGAGASWRETAVVLEELGRAVAPVPFLGSAVLATAALLAAATDRSLLAELASGTKTAVLAVPFGAHGAPTSTVDVFGGALTGTVTGVADALVADVLLVPAADGGLYAVESVTRTPVVTLDLTRPLADLRFNAAPGRRVGDAGSAVAAALTAGAALIAAEQLGLASWCLETTVEYVKTRYQFGRPVGSFQALKHRLADLWMMVTQARAVARYAADCLATGDPDLPVAAALAKAHCSAAAVLAAEECVQLHGGIGFTWEHPAHLYLKRAKSTAIALGTPNHHRTALAHLTHLPPTPPTP